MRDQTYRLAGETCTIHFPETDDDASEFLAWHREQRLVGLDTETTGLDVFSADHGLRLVQFGNATEAWVLRADQFAAQIREALARGGVLYALHNMTYDLLVLDRHEYAALDDLGPKCFDTTILAHLLDPRPKDKGGTGRGLKDLAAVWIDPSAPDTATELHTVFRREYQADAETGWRVIDVDHPVYWLYAGLDVLLSSRLFSALAAVVKSTGLSNLSTFDHEIALVLATMQRRGIKLDVRYTEKLSAELSDEAERYATIAATFGVSSVNSPPQVVEALTAMGETLSEKTPSGAPKVDKEVLAVMADIDARSWERLGVREPNPLADAILRSKRAGKWRTSYTEAMLDLRDGADRIHPSINGLAARTARMSVSNPPLQQLPSGDWRIRRCMVADPGKVIVACDFAQIEMRVLAALCGDERLQHAILNGIDLHDFTASLIFGEDFTKGQRKIAKMAGLAKVYGGGATTIARQGGISMQQAKEASDGYARAYPGITRWSRKVQRSAEFGECEVVTPSGRHLPLDRSRTYAAGNAVIQSSAADIFKEALLDLVDAGLGDCLLLPVHDEVVAQADEKDANEIVHEISRVMNRDFYGIPLLSDPEVYGRSWGHGYGAPDDA